MVSCSPRYVVDPTDPRAPSQELWDKMTPQERLEVEANLPSEFPYTEAHPPEGDVHDDVGSQAKDSLRRFFQRSGKSIYVARSIPVYYPGEPMFSADLIAVQDVATHPRNSWMVSKEGKGLDLAMEIHVLGNWRKDSERNRIRYAQLGISEYFIFDVPRHCLLAYRLPAQGADVYQPVLPQHGMFHSNVLGLDLMVLNGKVRFYCSGALVPAADGLIATLEELTAQQQAALAEAVADRLAAEEALEQERAAREQERAAREQVEAENARLKAELEKLRGK